MWLLAMVLAAVCIETAAADSIIPPEVSEAVPPEAAQVMEEIGDAPRKAAELATRRTRAAIAGSVASTVAMSSEASCCASPGRAATGTAKP